MKKTLNANWLAAGMFGLLSIYAIAIDGDAGMAAVWAALTVIFISQAQPKAKKN